MIKTKPQTSGVKLLKRAVTSAAKTEVSKRRGRPSSGKIVVSIRLDPDVVEKFKATGPGWQQRVNDALKKVRL